MSCDFKPTSVTLLQRIAIERKGEDEATRVRFWELYQPAMLMSAKITEEAYRRKVDVTVTTAALASEQIRLGRGLYMAPEVRNGGKATPASDAYAVGVLLFRLLTGSQLTTETRLEEALAGLDYNVTNVIKQTVYEIVTFTNVVDRPAKRQK